MKVIGAGFPFSWNEALGSPLFDQTSTTQIKKKGIYQKQPKKEAVWGHWEVIGIGEPIFDQKLRPIVAEEVIKILFPCFWSDAINSCENPKSKKYKKKSEKLRHPSTSTVSYMCCFATHAALCPINIVMNFWQARSSLLLDDSRYAKETVPLELTALIYYNLDFLGW